MRDAPFWSSDPGLSAEAEVENEKHHRAKLDVIDARPLEYSDEALALRFTERHSAKARYVARVGEMADLGWRSLAIRRSPARVRHG